jgi:hypothetical protein
MSKPRVLWSNKGENEDFGAAQKYLSLIASFAGRAARGDVSRSLSLTAIILSTVIYFDEDAHFSCRIVTLAC